MNKRIFLIAVLPVVALLSCKQNYITGHGQDKSETRSTAAFSKVEISAPVKAVIHLQNGATPSVQLSGYENLVKAVKTEVRGNTLYISIPESTNFETDKDVVADITMPAIDDLSLTGSADVDIKGNLTGSNFSLAITGVSDVLAENISVSNFDVDITGAGSLKVENGNVQKANYTVTGSGDINAFPLRVADVKTTVSGAGDIELHAEKKLEVSISGAGDVHYKGHPTINSETTGAGSLDDAN